MGLEGIVAKRGDSPYRAGYSADWLKVRVDRSSDFAVVGFEPEGRAGLRRLHLAVRDGGRRGWPTPAPSAPASAARSRGSSAARLDPLRRAESPPVPAAADRGDRLVEPGLVVEVRYKEWTEGGHLRHPVFLRLRDDKTAAECFRPGEERADAEEVAEPARRRRRAGTGRPPSSPTSARSSGPGRGSPRGS